MLRERAGSLPLQLADLSYQHLIATEQPPRRLMNEARPAVAQETAGNAAGKIPGKETQSFFLLEGREPLLSPCSPRPGHRRPLGGQLLCLGPTRPRLCASGSRNQPHSSLPRDIPAVPPCVMSHGGETLRTALPFIHCSQERSDRPNPRPTGASRNCGGSHQGEGPCFPPHSPTRPGGARGRPCRVSRAGARPPAQAPP